MNNMEVTQEAPLISVIVPVYNVEKYLEKCVDSIINQSYHNLEIILVDDGSTDNCPVLCDKYKKKDDRIIVIHQKNGGLSAARNAGLDIAKGEYIGFIDSDDYISIDMYEKLLLAIKKCKADMGICNYIRVNELGTFGKQSSITAGKTTGIQVLTHDLLNNFASWVIAWNKLYKRNLFYKIRYPIGKLNEDSFIIHKLLYETNTIACINDICYFYLQRNNSIMNLSPNIKKLDDTEAYFSRADYYLRHDSIPGNKEIAAYMLKKGIERFHEYYYSICYKKNDAEHIARNDILQKQYRYLLRQANLLTKLILPDSKIAMCACYLNMYMTWKAYDTIKGVEKAIRNIVGGKNNMKRRIKHAIYYIVNGSRIRINTLKRKRHSSVVKIKQLKDTKKGKRCFIVGNGPSLTIEDLERIKGEDSFAVNRIYKIFEQTEWRPTFYFSQDERIVDEIKNDVHLMLDACEGVFLNSKIYPRIPKNIKKNQKLFFFYLNNSNDYYPELPAFSFEPDKEIYEGFTVAYACIQMAVYMGYSEIYIIGTDHSYNINRKTDGTIEEDQTVTNYMPGLEGKLAWPPQMEKSTLAFRKARQVCDESGIIIRNATRGGKLEEFERVDFNSLF